MTKRAFCASVPDAKALKYIPDKVVVYVMVDPKNLWSRIEHLVPPGYSRGGKPVAPDPTAQKLIDLVWGSIDGPVVIAATGFDEKANGLVVLPTRPNASRKLVNDILAMARQQGPAPQITNRKIAGVDTIVITPPRPAGPGKSKAPSKRMMTPMAIGATPDKLFVATPSDVVIMSTSEALLTSALQGSSKGGSLMKNKSFSDARGRIGSGQVLWIWGTVNQGPLSGNLEISIRSETKGLRFGGFIPLRGK